MFDSEKVWDEFYTAAFMGDLDFADVLTSQQADAAAAGWRDRLELGGDVVTINEAQFIHDCLRNLDCDFGCEIDTQDLY